MTTQSRNQSTVSTVYQVDMNRSLGTISVPNGDVQNIRTYLICSCPGKWSNLHWYCKICEVEVRNICEIPAQVKDSSNDLNDRGVNLEQMMDQLEKKMEDTKTEMKRS